MTEKKHVHTIQRTKSAVGTDTKNVASDSFSLCKKERHFCINLRLFKSIIVRNMKFVHTNLVLARDQIVSVIIGCHIISVNR
jgi:hypothetical protein